MNKNGFNDYFKAFGEFKNPSFDIQQIFSIGRRNAEAFSAAGSVVAESVQAITRHQAESVRSNFEQMLKATKDMMVGGSPEINTTKQAELAKNLFEASLQNMRETSEMMTKSMFEASDVINKRASQSIEEMSKLNKAA